MDRKLVLMSVAVAAFLTSAGMGTAHADSKTAIDKGGEYCLAFGSTAPGATNSVLYLDIDPADHLTKPRSWWVSGVTKGKVLDDRDESYVSSVSGSATLAKPNNGRYGAKRIHMSLSGTSFGTFSDPTTTGLWELNANLQLNPKTLKGKIVRLSVFTPITGTTAGTPTTLVVNEKIRPVNCKTA